MTCPQCGSTSVDRDEVDIGVGVQCGPWGCFDCGWVESYPIVEQIEYTEPSPGVDSEPVRKITDT